MCESPLTLELVFSPNFPVWWSFPLVKFKLLRQFTLSQIFIFFFYIIFFPICEWWDSWKSLLHFRRSRLSQIFFLFSTFFHPCDLWVTEPLVFLYDYCLESPQTLISKLFSFFFLFFCINIWLLQNFARTKATAKGNMMRETIWMGKERTHASIWLHVFHVGGTDCLTQGGRYFLSL